MATQTITSPVEDSIPKVGDGIAVGEDLEFQRKWWRFERVIWLFFLFILLCDVLGLFGRGWLSKATLSTPDAALTVDYERIARAGTPSIMTLHFGPQAIHDGVIHLYVSDSLVKPLGAQRISPQPAVSSVGNDGITYTFSATRAPATVQIALEPSFPGSHPFRLQLLNPNQPPSTLNAKIYVVP
jgi:hypothetical protein